VLENVFVALLFFVRLIFVGFLRLRELWLLLFAQGFPPEKEVMTFFNSYDK
jgi:hypothetical protein